MVTDDERALVWRAVHAQRAYFEREQRERDRAQAREEWFYASTTRDEAIERGTQCYLAAVRGDQRSLRPLHWVNLDTVRAMVRSGELSVGDACNVVWVDGYELEVSMRELFRRDAAARGALPRPDEAMSDDEIARILIQSWSPHDDGSSLREVLQFVDRARLVQALRAALAPTDAGFGEDTVEDWLTARVNDASLLDLAVALLEERTSDVAELFARLRRAPVVPLDCFSFEVPVDARESLCAQLCRFGHHAHALACLEDILREPVLFEAPFAMTQRGISLELARTLRASVAPEVLAGIFDRAVSVLETRASTADEWLALLEFAATDRQRTPLLSRALVLFDAQPCLLDGRRIPRDELAPWSVAIEKHLDGLLATFNRADRSARSLDRALAWIDFDDPRMVRSLWGAITRVRDALNRSAQRFELQRLDSYLQRAGHFGSDEARRDVLARRSMDRSNSRRTNDAFAMPDWSYPSREAQQRWVERVLREAPTASRVFCFAEPTPEQQRASDFARIESGRESLWKLVSEQGVASREAKAVALDRWYRAGCPVDGSGCSWIDVTAAVAQSMLEGPCERRTRWLWSREELLSWIEATDVDVDDSWRAEPGLRWLIDAFESDERGQKQLRRLFDARLDSLRRQRAAGRDVRVMPFDLSDLLIFASEAQLARLLEDDDEMQLLVFEATRWRPLRSSFGARALSLGLDFARRLAARPAAGWTGIDTLEGIVEFVEESVTSLRDCEALIASFAPDVRAMSDDWSSRIDVYVLSNAPVALRRYAELDAAQRVRARALIERSSLDERSVRYVLCEDPAEVVANLRTIAPTPNHAPIEYIAALRKLAAQSAIDAIGDVLVDWLIDEERGRA